ncbi:hypothetical protein KW787_01995 [Candidatus Pacearchaeota archaeon]|nr:hypothetical protein [Candidatus Pacearchaeota archaeon]
MKKENKKWVMTLSVIFVIVLALLMLFYFFLYTPSDNYGTQQLGIANPVGNMTVEQAITHLNESFIFYFLYSIKAYDLHNPPLGNDTPKIQFVIGANHYYGIVENGNIRVATGNLVGKDIILKTSPREAILMLKDRSYIASSFQSGNSSVELVADKTTLFAKGYLNIYKELTGKTITGSIVRR